MPFRFSCAFIRISQVSTTCTYDIWPVKDIVLAVKKSVDAVLFIHTEVPANEKPIC